MTSRLEGHWPTEKPQPKGAIERLRTPETDIEGRLNEVQSDIDLRVFGVLDTVRRAAETYPKIRSMFEAFCDNSIDMHQVVQDIRHDPVAEELAAILDRGLAESVFSNVKVDELKSLYSEEQRLIELSLEKGTQS